MLNQKPNTQELFQSNQVITNIVTQLENTISKLENHYHLPSGYLKTSLALHLPQYPLYTLYPNSHSNLQINHQFLNTLCWRLAKSIYTKINALPLEFRRMVVLNQRNSKVVNQSKNIIEINNKGEPRPVYFSRVNSRLGELIQRRLHYIACPREDTLFHFGLFRQGDRFPFAYAAFSILDRKYIHNNLPFRLSMDNLLVLTRSFNINNSPENSMSLLFGLCRQFFKNNFKILKFHAILTAVNPNIFLKAPSLKPRGFFLLPLYPLSPCIIKADISVANTVRSFLAPRTKTSCSKNLILSIIRLTASQQSGWVVGLLHKFLSCSKTIQTLKELPVRNIRQARSIKLFDTAYLI